MKSPIFATLLFALLGSSIGSGLEAQSSFSSRWPEDRDRVWIGSQYWGNRLQDWRVTRGRVECLVSNPQRPVRVLHLLTVEAGQRKAGYEVQVRCGPVDPQARNAKGSLRGFLIGCGGPTIDYHITALAHSRPAEDGGLVAGLDDVGRLVFRDFNHNEAPGSWAIGGKLKPGEFQEIEAARRGGAALTAEQAADTYLRLSVQPDETGYRIRLSAVDPESSKELCFAELGGRSAADAEGSFGLVSHMGPGRKQPGAWFQDWRLTGKKLDLHQERRFGPILGAFYTLSRGVLKMSVQMPPIGAKEGKEAVLEVKRDGEWVAAAKAELDRDSYTYLLRVEDWDGSRSWAYRVHTTMASGVTARMEGVIAQDPVRKKDFVLAAFTGTKHFTGGIRWNGNGIWFPHKELCEAVEAKKPDLLFFSGDQIYEGDITGAQRRPDDMARLDYLDKWYRWVWAFRDLARTRPCITIPDDHDVYHGNIWGAGGRKARRQDDGGYTMPARFVRMVERTQTSHLPDAFDPRPVEQGIGVYYTSLEYGGMSFAILEDRKFKDSPTPTVLAGKFKNGWAQADGFDAAKDADVEGATLLGQRQLDFLAAWARDWKQGTRMKVALSQTIFANVATIPIGAKSGAASAGRKILAADVYPSGWKKAADGDSNGWPQTGRNKAVRLLRKAFASHVAGDQHLASFIRYGVDEFDDGGIALCVPSIGNTWPRRWWPTQPGEGWQEGQPRYTGRYLDGWGNRMTVFAVANPSLTGKEPTRLHDRAPGYGIVRFDKEALTQRFECWPRWAKPDAPDTDQYRGWPRTFLVQDNYARKPMAWLPEMHLTGLSDPLVEIVDAKTGEHVYSVRMKGKVLKPWTFAAGSYQVHLGEPGTQNWKDLGELQAKMVQDQKLEVAFAQASETKRDKRPNIIFIMADDLGYRELGSYGQKKIKTPNLDRLAGEGMRFLRHYAGSPVCAPSRCVLLTGRHPGHAEVRDNGEVQPEGQRPISAQIPTIASLLQKEGYVTGAFGKWGLGFPGSEGDPLKKGFDRFFGYNCQRHAHSYYPDYLWDDDKRIPLENVPKIPGHAKLSKKDDPKDPKSYARFIGKDFASDRIADQVLEFVRKNKDKPFFLYYPTIIPHLALQVPEDSVTPYRKLGWEDPPHRAAYTPSFTPRATYAGMITRMDSYVGRIMALLEELELDKNTVVIFTSDNGATYLGPMAEFFDSVGELRGLKGRSYEGGLRVPAIVRFPGRVDAGSTTEVLSGFEDWMPTLMALAGASSRVPEACDGRSILPTLLGQKQGVRPWLYREFAGYGGQQAGWMGPWKAIRTGLHKRVGPIELYDLSKDPGEKNDVANEHAKLVAMFEELFRREHKPSQRFPLKAIDQKKD